MVKEEEEWVIEGGIYTVTNRSEYGLGEEQDLTRNIS